MLAIPDSVPAEVYVEDLTAVFSVVIEKAGKVGLPENFMIYHEKASDSHILYEKKRHSLHPLGVFSNDKVSVMPVPHNPLCLRSLESLANLDRTLRYLASDFTPV